MLLFTVLLSFIVFSKFYSQKYLINTSECKIPNIEPFNEETNRIFSTENYTSCSDKEPLIFITKENGFIYLNINEQVTNLYTNNWLKCCYLNIARKESPNNPDIGIRFKMNEHPTTPRKLLLLAFVICCFLLLFFYKESYVSVKYSQYFSTEAQTINYTSDGYLVASTKCKIPDLDPFNPQAKKFYHPEKYTSCRKHELLTYVTKTDNITTLHVDSDIIPSYSKKGVTCCYSNITRKVKKSKPDDHIEISKCTPFKRNVTITEEAVMVKCKNAKTKKQVYENTHYIINIKKGVRNKIDQQKNNTAINVLFVGIDSISRLNFVRSLPKTYGYVENNDWIPLHGYNKIEDNTFPNLMAILTGYNISRSYSVCNPKVISRLDNCSLLWYEYRNLGYVTAYGEDEAWINTFNYNKFGFTKEPTDYYLRPYMIASEKLKTVKKDSMTYCTGPETSGERILNAAKDFAVTFKDFPSFGFFWMNTFSHNEVNSPSGMDIKVKGFLEDLSSGGVLEKTFVIFLSDHGIRFGDIRYTFTGWLEERLPFIYISVPTWFKATYRKEYNNLINNANKLTTPYDMYLTLQHILVLSGSNYTIKPSEACPGCKSLFQEIESERSCEDAAIEPHWCTCTGYSPIDAQHESVKQAANFTISQIEDIIRVKGKNKLKCAKFTVKKIISSNQSENVSYKNDTYLLVVFETKPKAVFESTILLGKNLSLVGSISRLDRYSSHSHCTEDAVLKKYCYCL